MQKLRSFSIEALLVLAWFVLCLVPSADAQVTASGVFHADTLNLEAPIATLPSAAAAVSIQASTSGSLSCSTYPIITVYATRNAQQLDLADFTNIGAGSSWTTALNFIALDQGDQVYAQITTAGVGCTNDVPLTVSLVYMPAAGICYSNPSACVDVTGFLAGANGLGSSNYTATFTLNQIGFLGGTPPGEGSGGGVGTCETLGASPGDICYFTGSSWTILTGNHGAELFLSETSGVPSWEPTPSGGTYAENLAYIYNSNCTLAGGILCSDFTPTPPNWFQDLALLGPLPPTYPSSNIGPSNSCGTGSITTITCSLGYIAPGDTVYYMAQAVFGLGGDVTFAVTDNQGNNYTLIDHANGISSAIPSSNGYAVSLLGGPLTVTVVPNVPGGGDNVGIVVNIVDLHGVGALQQHASAGPTGTSPDIILPAITTSNANDTILGSVVAYSGAPAANSAGAGYAMLDQFSQFTTFGSAYMTSNTESAVVTATGTYTPHMTGNWGPHWVNAQGFTVAFANTLTANIGPYTSRQIQNPDLMNSPLAPFYNARNLPLAKLNTDTLLDWHVGSPINNEGDTTNYSSVVLNAVGSDAAYTIWAYVDCAGSVATVTPTITYTDAAGNSHTLTGSAADCTSHATGVIPDQTIRAKASTNITFSTTHTGTPTWNTSAGAAQRSNQ